jgi:hypothetical protein
MVTLIIAIFGRVNSSKYYKSLRLKEKKKIKLFNLNKKVAYIIGGAF